MSEDEKASVNGGDTEFELPKLQPILIRTKNKNIAVRIFRWVTSIRKWRLLEDWQYKLPDGTNVLIPKGFIFDGASIPRALWGILSPTGLLFIPGLIHDFAYRYDYLWAVDSKGELYKYKKDVGQEFWDKTFNEIAAEVNGLKVLDGIAWAMLAVFGRFPWASNRKLNDPEIFPDSFPKPSENSDSSTEAVAVKSDQSVSNDLPDKSVDVVETKQAEKTASKPVLSSVNDSSQVADKPAKAKKPRKPRKTKKPAEIA